MDRGTTIPEKYSIGQRFDDWVLDRVRQRRGSTDLPRTFEYRHIYVMPTVFGFWFGMLLILMTVGGLNFNNNMTLLMGFMVASIAMLTTLLAYRNLVGVTLYDIRVKPVFCGEQAQFRILLGNREERQRYAIQAVSDESVSSIDIEEQDKGALCLSQQTWSRGWEEMAPFRVENRFPLGLFRAWSVIIPRTKCLVYPLPAAHPPPLPRTGRGDYGVARKEEDEHFHGLRDYRAGDPPRRIAWRASARHGKLFTRVMESPSEEACELNWYLMAGADTEKKVSILTAWVLKAERSQIPYSLEMPGSALPANLGPEHRDACLKILALHGL